MSKLQNTRAYVVSIASVKELHFWGDDRHARNLTRRWIRRYWPRFVAQLPHGSMALAFASQEPEVWIGRYHWHPVRGVRGCGLSHVDSWHVAYN